MSRSGYLLRRGGGGGSLTVTGGPAGVLVREQGVCEANEGRETTLYVNVGSRIAGDGDFPIVVHHLSHITWYKL